MRKLIGPDNLVKMYLAMSGGRDRVDFLLDPLGLEPDIQLIQSAPLQTIYKLTN
jgi:hypothetical protein